MQYISISTLLPELILLIGGCIVLLGTPLRRERAGGHLPWVTLLSLVAALVVAWFQGQRTALEVPTDQGSGLYYHSLAAFVRIAALELGILIALVNWSLGQRDERGEFLSMMLFSLCGVLLVAAADNLLILFLALELVSIPTYIMVVLSRTGRQSLEAGTKYFYLGALAAAIMAYGFSFLYGVSGTLALGPLAESVAGALANPGTLKYGLAVIGILLSLTSMFFKIGAVPLHFYIADVYQGAASQVAGLLGFVPKIAGLVAIFKLIMLTGYWEQALPGVLWLLWIVAVLSMTVGNVLALRQTSIKRMLAYSGVAHAGYMLVGVIAGPLASRGSGGTVAAWDGTAAVLYYVVIYGIANLLAFAILGLLRVRRGECETVRDVAGLLRREPALALLLALAMFTLMGLPPTPGFWGKLSLFGSALTAARAQGDTWLITLVIIGVVNSAIGAAYYLRVIAAVLLQESDEPAVSLPHDAQRFGALLCGLLILIFTLYPTLLSTASQRATAELQTIRTTPPAQVAAAP